jgi:hypothetical protein
VQGKAVDEVSDFSREVEEVEALVACLVWGLLSDDVGATLSCHW